MLKLLGFPTDEEIKDSQIGGRMLVVAPSVKAICNYGCWTCFAFDGKAVKGEIGIDEHKLAIGQASELGAKYMIIAMVGEPFMDKAFYKKSDGSFPMVDYANENGIYVVTFTNTSLVTPIIASDLKRKDSTLIGKLWSMDRELDDELTGFKKEWVRHNGVCIPIGLKYLVDEGFNDVQDGETRLGIDIVVNAMNYKEIPEIASYAINNGIKPIIDTMIPMEMAQKNYSKLKMTPNQNQWLYTELVKVLGEDFTKDQFVEGCATRQVGFAYDNFGNVKVCCALGSNVGNIKNTPVKDLYNEIQMYRSTLPKFEKIPGTLNACDTARFVKEQSGLD